MHLSISFIAAYGPITLDKKLSLNVGEKTSVFQTFQTQLQHHIHLKFMFNEVVKVIGTFLFPQHLELKYNPLIYPWMPSLTTLQQLSLFPG